MPGYKFTRRQAMTVAAIGLAGTLTGANCNNNATNTTGDVLISIGTFVFRIPVSYAKVVAIALIVGGGALKIWVATKAGDEEREIGLTREEMNEIKKALAEGKKATVTQPDGTKEAIAIKKQ